MARDDASMAWPGGQRGGRARRPAAALAELPSSCCYSLHEAPACRGRPPPTHPPRPPHLRKRLLRKKLTSKSAGRAMCSDATMSARTLGVAVAVSAMVGTPGK